MEKQSITHRIIKSAIFFAFLFCYLEWAKDHSGFMFQLEYEVFAKNANAESFMHPLIFIPFAGQLLLAVTVLLNKPAVLLSRISILSLSVLVLMFLLVGILKTDVKIAGSTLPFLLLSVHYFRLTRKRKNTTEKNP